MTTAEETYGGMMIDRASFTKSLEDATLEELIKKRDKLILEIRRYEKNKELRECDFFKSPPKFVYIMNNEYLAELCHLINEKLKYALDSDEC